MSEINDRRIRVLERIHLLSSEKTAALERLDAAARDMGEFIDLLDPVWQLLPTSLRERIDRYRS